MTAPDTPSTEAAEPPAQRAWVRAARQTLRGVGWLGHWLPGAALALLLAGGVAGWIWSGSEGSLARALGWAQTWMSDTDGPRGQLQASGAQGSLRNGGQVGQVRWSRQGLDLQLQGLRLQWSTDQLIDALLGRGLRVQSLHLDQVLVTDQREPIPAQPPAGLELPLTVDLPWSVDLLRIEGRQTISLSGASGHYRYGPAQAADRQAWDHAHPDVRDVHHLRIDKLSWAQGRYQLQAVLGAQAPMPLHATALGQVLTSVPGGNSLTLQASATASGLLAGQTATLDLNAQVNPGLATAASASTTPTLVASARVQPWALQPLTTVDARAHGLDLAALWPQAPLTSLSGTVQASPDAGAWRARLDLRNGASGPWDRQRLPLDRLQAVIEQQGTLWNVPQLQATLGRTQAQARGRFQPAVGSAPAQWQGQLQASDLNPAQVWSPLATAALDLTASARQHPSEVGTIELDARLLPTRGAAAPAPGTLRELRLLGRWQASSSTLQLDEALLDAAQARVAARGVVNVRASTFSGSTTFAAPGAQGRWNGTLAHASGEGDLALRVEAADPLLRWVRSLQALPGLGPRLRDWLAQRPDLRDLQLDGQVSLQARWKGGLAELGYPAPRGETRAVQPLQLQATLDVPRLVGTGQPGAGSSAATASGWTLRGAQLQASGGLADLALQLRGEASQGPWSAALQTQGRAQRLWPLPGPSDEPGRLALEQLTLRASDARQTDRVVDWTLRSLQPLGLSWHQTPQGVALQSGPAQWQLQPAVRGGPPGAAMAPVTLVWDQLAWQAGALQTRGRLSGLPLTWVDQLARTQGQTSGPVAQAGLNGDLIFDGDWDLLLPLQGGEALRLTAQLQRRSGDLVLLTEPEASATGGTGGQRLPAGIRSASLSLNALGRDLQARLRWDSERLGQASAELGTQLAASPAPNGALLDRWWPANTPLNGTVSARLPQVGVWSAVAPPGWRMRGTLQAEARLSGTRTQPVWRGTLAADELFLRSVVDGFEFSQGVLRATLDGERLTVDRFDLQGGLGGSLSATGQAHWPLVDGRRQPQIDLQLRANSLRVSNRADRRLTLSGQVAAQLAGVRLHIRGQLKADSALFVLPDETTPTLSTDVVVRGGRNLQAVTSTVAQVQPDVSVRLDLGDRFEVRGRGLQARLTGQLNLLSTVARPAPRVFGEVRTASGTYRAYGQLLTIENGTLLFNGPYDDPALDILAIRPMGSNTDQRVGVQINGSTQEPRVRLVATPDLPDSEKLAWLVLGRPATGGGAEAAVLQQAALALLAGNDGVLNGGLAQALGLDELSFRGETTNADGSTRAAAVTLGKRLSNQLYLSYQTGLAGTMGTVSVFYDISRRFTLRARAGEENAIDLIFTLQYD